MLHSLCRIGRGKNILFYRRFSTKSGQVRIAKNADGTLIEPMHSPILNPVSARNNNEKREISDLRKKQWGEYIEKSQLALAEAGFNKALKRTLRHPSPIRKLEVEKWFRKLKPKASIHIWHRMMQFYIAHEQIDKLYPLLESMRLSSITEPSSHTYAIIIHAFADRGDVDIVWRLTTDMEREGVLPLSQTYLDILHAYAKHQSPLLGLRYFDSLKSKTIRSLPLYHAALELIRRCNGPWDTAVALVQQMQSEAPVVVIPDATTYRMLLEHFDPSPSASYEELCEKLEKLAQALSGYVPVNDSFLQAALQLSAPLKGDTAQNLLLTFARLQKSVPLTALSYNTLIELLCVEGHIPLAIEAIRKMRSADVKVGMVAESYLVSEFVRSFKKLSEEDALGFIDKLASVKHSLSHLSLHKLLSRVHISSLTSFFAKIQDRYKFKPTVEDYNVVLRAFAQVGDFPTFSKVMSELTRELRPNIESYNALLLCFWQSKRDADALRVLPVLAHAKCTPNAETLRMIIDCCGMSFQMKFGQHVFDEIATQYKIEPTVEMWTSLIVGWCRIGKYYKAVEQFARFRDPTTGFEGDVPLFLARALLRALLEPNQKAPLEDEVLVAVRKTCDRFDTQARDRPMLSSEIAELERVLLLVSPRRSSPVVQDAREARRRSRAERARLRKEEAEEAAYQKELEAEKKKPAPGSWQALVESDPSLKSLSKNDDELKEQRRKNRRQKRQLKLKQRALKRSPLPVVELSPPDRPESFPKIRPDIDNLVDLLDSSKFEKPPLKAASSNS